MKFSFRSLVVKATSKWVRQFEKQIDGLRALIPIESAEAMLDQIRRPNGVFRLQVHLAVPGPDLRVESTGYTVQETMLKMYNELRRQIESRRARSRSGRPLAVRRPPIGR